MIVTAMDVHLLTEMSPSIGSGRRPKVKCGAELGVEMFKDRGPWTAWASQVTCGTCLEAMR